MPVYNDVFNFSTMTSTGFQASIQILDNYKNPANITNFSATMVLTAPQTNTTAFAWSGADFISKDASNFVINVPASSSFTPQNPIIVTNQYPYQVYAYQFQVLDGQQQNYFTLTGSFTLYVV